MNAKKAKTVRKLTASFFLFLILRLVEELYIIPNLYDTMGLVSCIGGLLILMVYIRLDNKPLEVIGMLFSKHKTKKGLLIAVVINAVPALIVYPLIYLSLRNQYPNLAIYYDKVANAYSVGGPKQFVMWALLGLLISVAHAFFYEMAFRGLLLTLASKSFPFGAVNVMQAGLYTFWYLIPVLRILIYAGGTYRTKQIVILVLFLLVYEMVTALKLGMLRRATGSIWVCIFDHIAFTYIFDMLHIQHDSRTLGADYTSYIIMLAYQLIAMILTAVYYKEKRAKIQDERRSNYLKQKKA